MRFDSSSSITVSVRSKVKANTWCVIHIEAMWTAEIEMLFHGPSHMYAQKDSYACQFGGIFFYNGNKKSSQGITFCDSLSSPIELPKFKENNVIIIQFYSGYSSGNTLITISHTSLINHGINMQNIQCLKNQYVYTKLFWEEASIFVEPK